MLDSSLLFHAATVNFIALLVLACLTWVVSLIKNDVSIIDSIWAVFFVVSLFVYAHQLPTITYRGSLMMVMTVIWAVRLSGYITWRNWGKPEDYRYREIRTRNQPHFEWKSLYLVFALQSVLAMIISLPLLAGLGSNTPLNEWDGLGILLYGVGLLFETIADIQLAVFLKQSNKNEILDQGLWRYTRHPNYFGECCVWWGFYLMAVGAGGGVWALCSPLLMTYLLLKISGVALLEKGMSERRPAYREYCARTNAFFPGLPRQKGNAS